MTRLALALAVLASVTAPIAARALEVAGRCRVTFFATSTVHDFEGSAPCAVLEIAPPDARGHHRARAEVAVDQLDTGIDARNRRMREMFDAERFPRITAVFEDVDPTRLRGQTAGVLGFTIAIHGVERGVIATTSGWSEMPDHRSARFRAEFDLSLPEFALEAPVAMGFVRVHDLVHVAVDVELAAK
jgi:polyisoprenoid-binding protein YceI